MLKKSSGYVQSTYIGDPLPWSEPHYTVPTPVYYYYSGTNLPQYGFYDEKTEKCRHCGELYVVYSMKVGDQSACPDCVKKARENMNKYADREGLDNNENWGKTDGNWGNK